MFRLNIKALVIAAVFSVFAAAGAEAAPDTKGTKFWIAFPSSYNPNVNLYVYITGDTDTSGQVRSLSPLYTVNFTVSAGDVTVVTLPNNASIVNNDSLEYKGIRVTALDEVTVYAMSRDAVKTDAFLAIPVEGLGTEYLVTRRQRRMTGVLNLP